MLNVLQGFYNLTVSTSFLKQLGLSVYLSVCLFVYLFSDIQLLFFNNFACLSVYLSRKRALRVVVGSKASWILERERDVKRKKKLSSAEALTVQTLVPEH
jgi:hypothetical protein